MISQKPITVSVRDGQSGREWGLDVYGDDAKAEVRAFFKKLWERYPADQVENTRQCGMSEDMAQELESVLVANLRLGFGPFDPRYSKQAEEMA